MTGFMVILEIDPPYLVTLPCQRAAQQHYLVAAGEGGLATGSLRTRDRTEIGA